jgi:adenylosuccinate lyase
MEAAEARACIATGDMLARLVEVLRGLRLDPVRMRKNLDLGGGLIMAEAVMLDLGAAIGRQHAHDVVYELRSQPLSKAAPSPSYWPPTRA